MPPEILNTAIQRRTMMGGAFALGVSGVLGTPVWARKTAAPAPRFPNVQALINAHVARKKFPGAVVSIGVGDGTDRPVDFITAGTIAYGSAQLASPDTLWRIYSMTKLVTGMATMALISEGKLKLDQAVADFIPAFGKLRVMIDPAVNLEAKPTKTRMTIRHLLTHTAGLGYAIMPNGPLSAEYERLGLSAFVVSRAGLPDKPPVVSAPSLAEFAERLASLPLLAEPGTRWNYAVGLDLLGRVIEIVEGKPFDTVLSERLFTPLGMTSTFFQVPKERMRDLATNYFLYAGIPYPVDPAETSIFLDPPAFPFGGAGLVSSARDYDRFLSMLVSEGMLDGNMVMSPDAVRLGMSNLLPAGVDTKGTFANGNGFGAGGQVTLDGPDKGSYGWSGAAGTVAWVDPVRKLRGAGFANYMPVDSLSFRTDVPNAVYKDLV